MGIYAALEGTDADAVLAEWGGQGFGAFKPALAERVVAAVTPIGDEMRRLKDDPAHVDRVLAEGAGRAAALARPVLEDAYAAMGLLGGGTARG